MRGDEQLVRMPLEQGDLLHFISSGDETYMKFVEKQPCALKYLLNTPEGSQYIKLRTESGLEDELLELIGRKVYA